ncbi:MAG: DNA repair protein RecN [FCB group bacterium]|nr:DNA repair protein RecN [FCB group bacterium]
MIEHITVRDFAILESVDLELKDGLTVITGETGSGKSILIQAIGVCLGAKPSKIMVRSSAERAIVESSINRKIFRRLIPQKGRLRSFIDDKPVSESTYKTATKRKADFHGQHEQQLIMDPETHIDYLDHYAGLSDQRTQLAALFSQIQSARKDLEKLRKEQARAQELIELYTFQLQELNAVNPVPGEDEKLSREVALLSHARELLTTLTESQYQLSDSEHSLIQGLNTVVKRLDRFTGFDDRLQTIVESLNSQIVSIQEAASDLKSFADQLDHDPERLQTAEERLQAIEGLKRKYGGSLEAVLESWEKIDLDLRSITGLGAEISRVEQELNRLETDYSSMAIELHNQREQAAKILAHDLETALERLAMNQAKVEVRIRNVPDSHSFMSFRDSMVSVSEKGFDRVEFYLSANPGEALKPLADIASGGEISRIMLGLKSVFQKTDPVDTMIFDEIDTGISGSTAVKVANALKMLSRSKQVFCITHLPQIANVADHHLHVTKTVLHGKTRVDIAYLDRENGQRVIDELTSPVVRN